MKTKPQAQPQKKTVAAEKIVTKTAGALMKMIKKIILWVTLAVVALIVSVIVFIKVSELQKNKIDEENQIQSLVMQIDKLEKKLKTIESQSSEVNMKDVKKLQTGFDDFSKSINESLALKAQEVSHLSHQVSQMEKKIQASSSKNALILTALGLVENAAHRGKPFVYEASVLNGLCLGTQLEKNAEEISKTALSGIVSDQELIERFEIIYNDAMRAVPQEITQEPAEDMKRDWKSFLLNKLKRLIVFEKIKKEDILIKTPEQEVLQFVKNKNFAKASLQMDHIQFFQTENFEIWRQMWRTKENFDDLMEKMKAYTLGALKVETLKK